MTFNAVKILALLLFIIAVIACTLFFTHTLTFDQSAIILLGDIAAYPTGAALITP